MPTGADCRMSAVPLRAGGEPSGLIAGAVTRTAFLADLLQAAPAALM